MLPYQATVTVTGGVDVEVTAGDTLTPAIVAEGFPVVIDKEASFVLELVDTTHFTLTRAVTNGVGLPCDIQPFAPQEFQIATLNARSAELLENLRVVDANGRGIFMYVSGETGPNDPGPTFLRFNGALDDPEGIDEIYMDVIDANQLMVLGIIMLWDIGTVLTIRSVTTNAYISKRLTVAPTSEDSDEWASIISLEHVDDDGLLVEGEAIAVEWNRQGNNADLGNPRGAYSAITTYSYRDMVTNQSALWIYHHATPAAGNAPPTLPTEANTRWQLIGGLPTVQDVLDELGVNSITISTSNPSGGVNNDIWLKVPV